MFSKSCQYGFRAAIFIAQQSAIRNRVGVKAISNGISSPEAFTAKVLQLLAKKGIINSIKGPHGGFIIEYDRLKEIKLGDIVVALDGYKIYNSCSLGLKRCSDSNPCPVHFEFVKIREELKTMLSNNTLYDILYKGGKKNNLLLKL